MPRNIHKFILTLSLNN